MLAPLVIPACRVDGVVHPRCLVASLHQYLDWTLNAGLERLFVWPSSLRPCSHLILVGILKQVISSADPDQLMSPACSLVESLISIYIVFNDFLKILLTPL